MRTFLTLILFGAAAVGGIMGLTAFSNAQSAVHEIEGLISVLIVAVAAGAGYVGVVLDEHMKRKAPPPVPGEKK